MSQLHLQQPVHKSLMIFTLIAVLLSGGPHFAAPPIHSRPHKGTPVNANVSRTQLATLPLAFEKHREGNAFRMRGGSYNLELSETNVAFVLQQTTDVTATLRMRFAGGRLTRPQGLDQLPGKTNYFLGKDPIAWLTDIPTYQRVRYSDVYPNIDLLFYGNQKQLEYDFVVKPGADPRAIRFVFDGASRTSISPDGKLVLQTAAAEAQHLKPVVFQETSSGRREIPGAYVLNEKNEVGFELGPYDRSLPLIIDPVFVYSTYLGGNNEDLAFSIALDNQGNAVVAGSTSSPDFPLVSPMQSTVRGRDIFLLKVNNTGTAVLSSTYLGGTNTDVAYSVAVDNQNFSYLTGHTRSINLPIVGGFQPNNRGLEDAFVFKIAPAGNAIVYSSYLGGSAAGLGDGDFGYTIAVDESGSVYITGETTSNDFPVLNALQPVRGGGRDAFLTRINPAGNALVFSTYIGGSESEHGRVTADAHSSKAGNRLALDAAGNAVVIGYTWSTDFPILNAFQSTSRGQSDVFVVRVSSSGSLLSSTYFGGNNLDLAYAVALDSSGNIFISGNTTSTNLPTTPGAFQTTHRGNQDVFLVKFNPNASAVLFSTYAGGTGADSAQGIAIDPSGNALLIGETTSTNFPVLNPMQPTSGGNTDVFLLKANSQGVVQWSTYLGGLSTDLGAAIAIGSGGNLFITGSAASPNFPTAAPIQFNRGGFDLFVARIFDAATLSLAGIAPNKGGNTGNVTVALSGAAFERGGTVVLKSANQPDIAGTNTDVVNGSQITTTFPLQGAAPGLRDVVVTLTDGRTAMVPVAFNVEPGRNADVSVDIVGRTNIRTNRVQTYTVIYTNRGNVDAPAPLIELSSPDAVQFALFDGQPFRPAPLRVFAGGQPGPAGVLAPGSYAMQVRVQTPSPTGQIRLTASIVTTAGQPFDWTKLAEENAPNGANLDQWRARVTLARSRIGESFEDVMNALRDAASRSHGDASGFYDFDGFLRYVVSVYGTAEEPSAATARKSIRRSRNAHHPSLRTPPPVTGQGGTSTEVNLITISEQANPSETVVIIHGVGGARDDFFHAAAAVANARPTANVYVLEWKGAERTLFNNQSTINDPWAVADEIVWAVEFAVPRFLQKRAQGFLDLKSTTVIAESDGVFVADGIADQFVSLGLGKINKAIALGTPTIFNGYTRTPALTEHFDHSVNIVTQSLFDTWRKVGDYTLMYMTREILWDKQHTDPINGLIANPNFFLGLPGNPALRKSGLPFATDGRINQEPFAYSPNPVDFLYTILLGNNLFGVKVLWKVLTVAIVNSHDPNEKTGPSGAGTSHYVQGTHRLGYVISFENVATATAPAQKVVITDRLDPSIHDVNTVHLGPISFGAFRLVPPAGLDQFSGSIDLRPSNNLIVKVDARLDKATGIITSDFQSIDPATGQPTEDPLAGFLPPNTNPPDGEGSVFFTVSPKAGLVTGSEMRNSASIVFDSNEAITTGMWLNVIDDAAPVSSVTQVRAVPCSQNLEVQWAGTDEGAGIRSYTVFVSDNGGSFLPWLINTTDTTAHYAGQSGHSYSFYTVAEDFAGNVEGPATNGDVPPVVVVNAVPTFTVSVSPAIVKAGSFAQLNIRYNNCTPARQSLLLKVALTTPRNNTFLFSLPLTIDAGKSGSLSLPLFIPKGTPIGTYTLKVDVLVSGQQIGTTSTQLTVIR